MSLLGLPATGSSIGVSRHFAILASTCSWCYARIPGGVEHWCSKPFPDQPAFPISERDGKIIQASGKGGITVARLMFLDREIGGVR